MSDTEFNVLDLKKILEANGLYKSGMTLLEIKHVYSSFKCKQALEAEGLYENGMSDQDIKDIYNTLKKSEETATNDNEYREILNKTNENCSNIDMLFDDSNTTNEIENDENLDVTSVQPVNTKPTPSKSVTKKQLIRNINVLMESKINHPLLKLPKVKYSSASLLYYHQKEILKLPINERAKKISQYLFNLHVYQKNDNTEKWSKPIEPCQKKHFNGDLFVDFIPNLSDEEEEVATETENTSKNIDIVDSSVKENSYILNRPKRVVKRKNYTDQLTDDEDDTTPTKKTKSSDDINLLPISPESKWITNRKRAISTPKVSFYNTSVSDRTNKIFDKLKSEENAKQKSEKKSTIQNLHDTLDLSSSDEEIFPTEMVTTVNIHEEDQKTRSKNGKTFKPRKISPKKRANINKLTLQKNSATKENEYPEIPPLRFYANSDDESNNNKLENSNSEDLTNCPICNKPFHSSKIQMHASNCMQFEGKDEETYCDICQEYIPDKRFQNHKYECIRKITEASTVVEKPVTRRQRNGFLCQVCDKFIVNASELQHASSCIAPV